MDEEHRILTRKLPFHDYLSKPIMIDALLFILAKWIKWNFIIYILYLMKFFKPTIPVLRINSGINFESAKLVEYSLKATPRMKALAVVINS